MPGDNIYLRLPALIQIGALRGKFKPLGVGQFGLYRVFKVAGLVLGGCHRVPHDRINKPLLMATNSFIYNILSKIYTIPGAGFAESKILTKNSRVFTRLLVKTRKPIGTV